MEDNMNITEKVFESKLLTEYIDRQLHNNWSGTKYENYPRLDPKAKGGFGELYVEALMTTLGMKVIPPTNPGHDRIINGVKTEIKFSLAGSNTKKDDGKLIDPDSFTFNHIAMEKDWDQFIFLGLNPDLNNKNVRPYDKKTWPTHRLYVMNKKDFVKHMKKGSTVFKHQQGGNKSNNDDFCVFGRESFYKLIKLPFVKEISLEVNNAPEK
jgi:hypothetical protein